MKVMLCGINAYSCKWCGCIFILCYTHLKLEFLLDKTVFVTFLLTSTVEWLFNGFGCTTLNKFTLELKNINFQVLALQFTKTKQTEKVFLQHFPRLYIFIKYIEKLVFVFFLTISKIHAGNFHLMGYFWSVWFKVS